MLLAALKCFQMKELIIGKKSTVHSQHIEYNNCEETMLALYKDIKVS